MRRTWSATIVVLARFDCRCALPFLFSGCWYAASEPTFRVSIPGAGPHIPHGDEAEMTPVGSPPLKLGISLAFEDTAVLSTWPRRFCDDWSQGKRVSVVRLSELERVRLLEGCLVFFWGMLSTGGRRTCLRVNVSGDCMLTCGWPMTP